MTIEPIRSDDNLRRALRRLEKIFLAVEGPPQGDPRRFRHFVVVTRDTLNVADTAARVDPSCASPAKRQ